MKKKDGINYIEDGVIIHDNVIIGNNNKIYSGTINYFI